MALNTQNYPNVEKGIVDAVEFILDDTQDPSGREYVADLLLAGLQDAAIFRTFGISPA